MAQQLAAGEFCKTLKRPLLRSRLTDRLSDHLVTLWHLTSLSTCDGSSCIANESIPPVRGRTDILKATAHKAIAVSRRRAPFTSFIGSQPIRNLYMIPVAKLERGG